MAFTWQAGDDGYRLFEDGEPAGDCTAQLIDGDVILYHHERAAWLLLEGYAEAEPGTEHEAQELFEDEDLMVYAGSDGYTVLYRGENANDEAESCYAGGHLFVHHDGRSWVFPGFEKDMDEHDFFVGEELDDPDAQVAVMTERKVASFVFRGDKVRLEPDQIKLDRIGLDMAVYYPGADMSVLYRNFMKLEPGGYAVPDHVFQGDVGFFQKETRTTYKVFWKGRILGDQTTGISQEGTLFVWMPDLPGYFVIPGHHEMANGQTLAVALAGGRTRTAWSRYCGSVTLLHNGQLISDECSFTESGSDIRARKGLTTLVLRGALDNDDGEWFGLTE